jgi:hypothetical protein
VRRQLVSRALLLVALGLLAGCDYQSERQDLVVKGISNNDYAKQIQSFDGARAETKDTGPGKDPKAREELLKNVIRLIETAANTPGGEHFAIAVDNLNQYFQGLDSDQFRMSARARAFLLPLVKEKGLM